MSQGEAVLDLGSGGGLDVFLAADRVGSAGIVVGLDGSKVRMVSVNLCSLLRM